MASPETMKAMGFHAFGGPEVLEVVEIPRPVPGAGEVVVAVRAVSVGRTLDIAARAGRLPFAKLVPPHVLGADHAGVIADVGPGVEGHAVGDRVAVFPVVPCDECAPCRAGAEEACVRLEFLGIHRQGAYAEYSLVPAKQLHRLADDVSFVDGAALALLAPLAYNQLAAAGPLDEGTWLMVQSGGSAAGTMVIALARHRGLRVIATSRSEGKREGLRALGVEAALDWREPGFRDEVLGLTGGAGVTAVIDNTGAKDLFATTLGVLSPRGRVVISGAFVGERPELDLQSLYTSNQSILGVRTANRAGVAGAWQEVDGGLRPVIDATFPLFEGAVEAHPRVESDQGLGRVVLTVGEPEHDRAGSALKENK
ncbi:MAG TPA: alcohol dehydrogenase catalytic domain-containing protein [Baekduia sp.]|uniref:zinc-binding dehydrogenase n=1 Tax=Baekduia sp. TaxID=2600305 RepID=UPI002D7788AF|nr:alcohol dehydrogenase catalytic domain-containing protein [Baekduia sp.]HET6509025.1 alcohol dehydrogenase catalytic domain-containing protein [Baekduia sp.]